MPINFLSHYYLFEFKYLMIFSLIYFAAEAKNDGVCWKSGRMDDTIIWAD